MTTLCLRLRQPLGRKILSMSVSVYLAEAPHRHWVLRNFDLFASLGEAELEQLATESKVMKFGRNDHICMSGVKHTHAYLVKEGTVRIVSTHSNGKRLTLALLQAGEIIGDVDFLSTAHRTSESAEAVDSVTILAVPLALLKSFRLAKPELTLAITKVIGERRAQILNRIQDVLFLTVPQRIARLVSRLAQEFPGTTKSGRAFVNLRLTHAEIADLIGSNREAVSATLARWKKSGPADMVKGFMVIRDATGLSALGQESSN